MTKSIALGLVALSLLVASVPASAGYSSCTTSCFGNTCTRTCY